MATVHDAPAQGKPESLQVLVSSWLPLYAESLRAMLTITQPNWQVQCLRFGVDALPREIDAEHQQVALVAGVPPDRPFGDCLSDLVNQYDGIPIVLLTVDADPLHVSEAFRLGLNGYLLLHETGSRLLVLALELASIGSRVISPSVDAFWSSPTATTSKALHVIEKHGRTNRLTTREYEVYQLLARGVSNREIAQRLGLNVRTAQMHVAQVTAKLGATSRTEAAIRAAHETLFVSLRTHVETPSA